MGALTLGLAALGLAALGLAALRGHPPPPAAHAVLQWLTPRALRRPWCPAALAPAGPDRRRCLVVLGERHSGTSLLLQLLLSNFDGASPALPRAACLSRIPGVAAADADDTARRRCTGLEDCSEAAGGPFGWPHVRQTSADSPGPPLGAGSPVAAAPLPAELAGWARLVANHTASHRPPVTVVAVRDPASWAMALHEVIDPQPLGRFSLRITVAVACSWLQLLTAAWRTLAW